MSARIESTYSINSTQLNHHSLCNQLMHYLSYLSPNAQGCRIWSNSDWSEGSKFAGSEQVGGTWGGVYLH